MKTTLRIMTALAAIHVLAGDARAFINPGFTPVHLVEQSDVILLVDLSKPDKKGATVATVRKVLKGDSPGKTITIELLAGAFEAHGKLVMRRIAAGQTEALLFVGMFMEEGAEPGPDDEEARGYLHLGGQWVVLSRAEKGVWDMDKIDPRLLGTWAGGTDMLLRCVHYVLSDPDADVPVRSGVSWAKELRVGKLAGKVRAAEVANLGPEGKPLLFVASDAGDRLFDLSGKAARDVTAARKLASRSLAHAWGDFNGDKRLDLASWDGTVLRIHLQQADGTLVGKTCGTGKVLVGGCVGLTTLGAGAKGAAAVLAATGTWPVLLTPGDSNVADAKPLGAGRFPGKALGKGGRCLVADFDGDGAADVLQLFARGGLFYKGGASGTFAAPVKTDVGLGKGVSAACLGDWDTDGLPDVFTSAEDTNRMYQNLGKGKFAESLGVSGEIAYISKPGGVAAQTGDFNNDGRPDVFIAYAAALTPQLFFNRGYRSFGHARMVDLAQQKLVPQAIQGQQAGCLGDFNDDGALDMVVVLADGETWLLPRKAGEDPVLAVRVTLPLGVRAGPITVWATREKRHFGAHVVRAGGPGALIGLREAGPVTVHWRTPDGKVHKKGVIVEDGPVDFRLGEKR